MALFSRRNPSDDEPVVDADPEVNALHADVSAATAAETEDAAQADAPAESVPHVNISVSTFGKAASPPPPVVRRGPEVGPPRTESLPGLPDNTLLAAAIAALPEKPDAAGLLDVMRQAMQGNLYVRVLGDARTQIEEKAPLRLAITTRGDEKHLLVYTGAAGLRAGIDAEPELETSALGQSAHAVLKGVVAGGYTGIVIDHAGPGRRLALPTTLIEKTLDGADPDFTIKNLLSDARTDATARYVAEALLTKPLWVAAGAATSGEGVGLAEARTSEGKRYLQVFSHPLEVFAYGREDRPVPLTAAQLSGALQDPSVTGILIDPAGPWIRLERPQLKALLALAADD